MLKYANNLKVYLRENKDFNEIFSGSVWAFLSKIIGTIASMIAGIIIARQHGPEVLGVVSIIHSFLLILSVVTVFGMNTSILKLIPQVKIRESISHAIELYKRVIRIVLFLSLVLIVLLILFNKVFNSYIFNELYDNTFYYMFLIVLIFKSILLINTQTVRAFSLIKYFAVLQASPQLIFLILLVILGFYFEDKVIPIYSYYLGVIFSLIISFALINKFLNCNISRTIDEYHEKNSVSYKYIIKYSWPMFVSVLMTYILGEAGILIIGMFLTNTEVAFYSVAVKFSTITSFALFSIYTIIAPKFSELYEIGDIDKLFTLAKQSARLIFYVSIPILGILLLFGNYILVILYGSEFSASYAPLIILLIGQFITVISGANSIFMNMSNNHVIFKNIMILSAFINIIMNFSLIPVFGIIGSAIASTISIITWNIITIIYIKKHYGNSTSYIPFITKL